MEQITVVAGKFHDLIDYLERLGVDVGPVAADAGCSLAQLRSYAPREPLSSQAYSRFYQASVRRLQAINSTIPWAAGLGSDIFEFLCYAIVSAPTLGEALHRAQRFGAATQGLTGHTVQLERCGEQAKLHYQIEPSAISPLFTPEDWPKSQSLTTVARTSGLMVWHGLCGWLIGHALESHKMVVAAPSIGDAYQHNVEQAVGCGVQFGGDENAFEFPAAALDYRIVQTKDTLQSFLDASIYQLSSVERQPASISLAIKGLLGADFSSGLPSFGDIAERLHMSESSLRRRLLSEETSFQIIKDQVRCEAAMSYLESSDIKINELAELLGFAEPSSFVRSFRHWTGITPKSYRDQKQSPIQAVSNL